MLEKPATTQSVLIVEDISSEFLQILAKQWLQAFGQLPIIQVYNRVLTHAAFDLSEMRKFARDIWVATTWGDVTESIQILQKVRGSVLLLDSATPGSGKVFDWGLLSTDLLSKVTWGLAGGVNPENIDDAIRLRPWLIDISSGVESAPRIKDFAKIKYIWERIRAAPKE